MADVGGSHPTRSNVCHRCDRRFSRLEHLQRHERSHTKEKPYKCVHCPKAFTRKDLLTRHLRISHPVTPPEVSSLEADGHLRVEHDDSDSSSPAAARTADSPDAPQLTPVELTDPGNAASGSFFPPPDVEPGGFHFDATAPPSLIQGYSLDSGSLGHTPDPAFTHDFASFMDAVPGLDQFSAEIYQPLPIFSSDFLMGPPEPMEPQNSGGNIARGLELGASTASQRPLETEPNNGAASSLSRYGSRLPSLQPEDRPPPSRPRGSNLIVTNEIRQRLVEELSALPNSASLNVNLILPSRHALTRFIGGYFKNFHNHYPFIHVPTLNMESISIELFLAMAALGARYTQEPEIAMELFHAARSITLERVQRAQGHPRWRHGADAPATVTTGNRRSFIPNINRTLDLVETMQALVLLVANSSFHKHEPGAAGALSMRSLLHSLALDESIVRSQTEPPGDWESWIKFESIKRTQLVVFSFFSIHTILFDLPPMMLVSDMHVDLPSSEREWSAGTEEEWCQCKDRYGSTRHDFQAAFTDLFYGDDAAFEASEGPAFNLSTLGGCGIIHALIQQIWLARNARFPKSRQDRGSLSTEEMRTFEHALKRWAACWERNQESSMDPLSPYGPVAFNSVALLRLAYIRLNMDLGPVRSLGSWDPALVARSIHDSPAGGRGKRLARAALHAAHALSIPVKLGINYVTRTQIMQWSNQYAICSLECAILLAKWLESVTAPDVAPPLTTAETRVLEFVVDLVAEAEYKPSRRQLLDEGGRLNAKIVRLWARLYQSESVWQMVNIIGETLHLYADLLEGASR